MAKFIGVIKTRHYNKRGGIVKQFQPNFLWRFIKNRFNKDVQIPLLTGLKRDELVITNTITAKGLARFVSLVGGLGGDTISYMALGTSTPGVNALGNQVIRGATTNTIVTTTITNDTLRCTAEFMFADTYTITEEGLFDDMSAGDMIASKTLPSTTMHSGEVYEATHEIIAVNG